ETLADLLNQNSYILGANKEASAIFRMTRKEGAQPNQFLILDVVQKGWVSP
ncbi:MAG: hypothetical protein JWO82_881, partial [Akkermansiaceae bacterium]|nr:hypothetical protein [Akkermansiaceae bacterium]